MPYIVPANCPSVPPSMVSAVKSNWPALSAPSVPSVAFSPTVITTFFEFPVQVTVAEALSSAILLTRVPQSAVFSAERRFRPCAEIVNSMLVISDAASIVRIPLAYTRKSPAVLLYAGAFVLSPWAVVIAKWRSFVVKEVAA